MLLIVERRGRERERVGVERERTKSDWRERERERDVRKTVRVSLSNYNKCQMPGQSSKGHIWLKSSCPISSYCQDSKYFGR